MRALILAAAVALAAPVAATAAPNPADVADAERAFAADGLELGIRDSFLKWSTNDAILLRPDPVNVHDRFAERALDLGGPPLVWWPVWAGVARSGDLGFTTGPSTFNGQPNGWYFTIWAHQKGHWKWIYDGGVDADISGAPGKEQPTRYLPVAARGAGKAAMDQVDAAEAKLAEAAASNLAAAYLAVLADDGRLMGSSAGPATDPAGFERELKTRPAMASFKRMGGRASSAGDLVWTYGEATWSKAGADVRGHYVRVWQLRPAGWALVFDELLEPPPAR
ncbi:MAG: DUF4440 domain-containing protein [Caulobacteraceae bacterium]